MRKIFPLIFFIIFLFSFVAPVYGGMVPCGLSRDDPDQPGNQTVPCQLCHLFVMVDEYVSGFLKYVVPSLATIMIAIGGMMLIFGAGKPETVSQAKSLFKTVIIGLIIIYGAWLIVDMLLSAFSVNKSFLQSWNTIFTNCPK